ncbi:hypothetical protein QTJ16_005180 [Diplocarpon rosae]|uniref:Uncharacterized protein n=1 Tax=Diplocarpon rosae TaxID=946125 RepID=A0AAD9SWI2_9HELO|nr:hypothetical protein QTJ16_005180 [Diplocarpon rosae]
MDSLRALSSPSVPVLRHQKIDVILRRNSAEAVPRDIAIIKNGDAGWAGLRVSEAMDVDCEEKSLTGDAEPMETRQGQVITIPGSNKMATGENGFGRLRSISHGMSYLLLLPSQAVGKGIVTVTGMQTEVGKCMASTPKRAQKPARFMNFQDYGKAQPVKGWTRRTHSFAGKFLGLSTHMKILTFVIIIIHGVYDERVARECNARYNTDAYNPSCEPGLPASQNAPGGSSSRPGNASLCAAARSVSMPHPRAGSHSLKTSTKV